MFVNDFQDWFYVNQSEKSIKIKILKYFYLSPNIINNKNFKQIKFFF